MATNVFEQTIDKEIFIASNQIASFVLEQLMPYIEPASLERYQQSFAKNFRPICSDKFASHILQKMIEISFLRGISTIQPTKQLASEDNVSASRKRKATEDIPDEKQFNLTNPIDVGHMEKCREFVIKMSKFLLNNLEDFVWDRYGCHLIRTCLMSLCGIFVYKINQFVLPNAARRARTHVPADKETPLVVPDDWVEIIQEYASRLQAWPQFPELPYDELSSGLLQSLCLALRVADKSQLKHLGKRILNDGFLVDYSQMEDDKKEEDKPDVEVNEESKPVDYSLPKVFTTESSIRLLESLLAAAGPKLMTQLYAKLFCSRLIALSEMKSANFTVQKLLDNVKQKEDFEGIFDELAPNIESLLQIGHTGVVNAMAQACLRLCAKQGAFVQSLQTALHCTAPNERLAHFATLTMKLMPYEVAAKQTASTTVHLHGSLILQAILAFNKPIKLVQSLLDTKPNELAELFSNPQGSHVVDAFVRSKFIGEKSREKFIKHMDGHYLDMAISKHGSRVVEALFEVSGDNQKARIVKQLADKFNLLNGSLTGRLLCYKFQVKTYLLSPAQWKAAFNKESKAEKLFKDIL